MFLVRVILNILIFAVEVGCVAAIGALLVWSPKVFAAVTAGLGLLLGFRFELSRLTHEAPYYFERVGRFAGIIRWPMTTVTAIMKAVIAGGVVLITFSGTDPQRQLILAVASAGIIWLASLLLRRLNISFGLRTERWGYFQMSLLLGLTFSVVVSFFPPPSTVGLAWAAIDLPARPSLAVAAELLFKVRLWIDQLVVNLLSVPLGPEVARIAGLFVSSNVLTGFVLSLYAVAVSEIIRVLDEANWRLTRSASG